MRAIPSLPGRGCDSVQAVTRAQALALANDGILWIARYIARDMRRLETPDAHGGDWNGCWTLSRSELRDIISGGIGVVPVQWGPRSGELLDMRLGSQHGQYAASYARWLGVPEGVHLWCDLEGRRVTAAGKALAREYVDGWSAACLAGGYRVGIYYSGVPFTAADLDEITALGWVSAWWRSAVKDHVPSCGLSIQQHYPPRTIHGVQIDDDDALDVAFELVGP